MPPQVVSPSSNQSLKRIVIVDDVLQVRQDLRRLLELTGKLSVVGEAGNGSEAIDLVKTIQPDAILIDLVMPVIDGYEATCQIKKLFPTCRVIALTAHDYPEARQKASQAGADGFVVKGAQVEVLVQAILGER